MTSTTTVDQRRGTVVVLAAVSAVALTAVALALWAVGVLPGGTTSGVCDVYCGPAPNLLVALTLAGLCAFVWIGAVTLDVIVAATGRPARIFGLVALGVQLVPVAVVLLHGLATSGS